MTHHEILVLGHVSKDINISPGHTEHSVGGAVVYSSVAVKRIGADVVALTKLHPDDGAALAVFAEHGVSVYPRDSEATTSIRNTYHTADRERRTCEALGMADPFGLADIPEGMTADLYYMGGLMKGEFPEPFVLALSQRGKVAVDVQGFLRVNEGGVMAFRDWENKKTIIPALHFLKTDAAEAEILTGLEDRTEAARTLNAWGADEVVLTHNSGVTVCVEGIIYTAPFTSRNLSGRTGRGDTCFCTYCYWRQRHGPEESCRFAAALTSLKMERPGPFSGTVDEVYRALAERYA